MIDSDISPARMDDIRHRDAASRRAEALASYARRRQYAQIAELHDDPRSAERHRADARASLHMFPALLAMVEPPEPPPVQAITSLVERIRPWTGTT